VKIAARFDARQIDRSGSVLRVYRGILSATPWQVATYVILYLVSQIALLAALLLPWKILVILSTKRAPGTLPSFLLNYDVQVLVPILSAAALAFFILHIMSEFGARYTCSIAVETVLNQHRKIGLFDRHREQAAVFYRRSLRLLAILICCATILLWLSVAYRSLLFACAIYCFLAATVAFCWHSAGWSAKYRLPSDLLVKTWWGGGFLFTVGWAIHDYWQAAFPGLTIALIAVLLVRQGLMLGAWAYLDHRLIDGQKAKVAALFDAETPWHPTVQIDSDFQRLLAPGQRERWIGALLGQHVGFGPGKLDIDCRPAESGNLIYITATCTAPAMVESFLLKLHHRSLTDLAMHESKILEMASPSWPAPSLLGVEQVSQHPCLLFRCGSPVRWLPAGERTAALSGLREQLLVCEPSEAFVERYDRGRPDLPKRLEGVDWNYLQLFSSRRMEGGVLHGVADQWWEIIESLRSLPRHLVLPKPARRAMGQTDNGKIIICNWSRWRWEPVGADWPISTASLARLGNALQKAAEVRPALGGVTGPQASYVSALYAFERHYSSKRFAAALELIQTIHGGAANFVSMGRTAAI